jgi:acetylglutamate kinase
VSLSASHVLPTDDNGIGVINLRTDHGPLLQSGILDDDERSLLTQVATIHHQAPHLVTSITSPLDLLRELFTVRGAGTLIKTGSSILRVGQFSELDLPRLRVLIETAFGRHLKASFVQSQPLHIYFEEEYRGAAVVQPGMDPGSAYLTKFAVVRTAQGEGLGRELWEAVVRDYPVLYWRARVQNPIASWYASQCDGMHRVGDWWIYWRGVPFERVPELCNDALKRPYDLV